MICKGLSNECCVCAYVSECLSGCTRNIFEPASRQEIVRRISEGAFSSDRKDMIDYLKRIYGVDYISILEKENEENKILNKSTVTETQETPTREKETIVSVDYLLSLFQKLSELGKGDMKIKCIGNYLHEDEITIDHLANEILLRGNIFNFSIADKVSEFCSDIEKARERFYM